MNCDQTHAVHWFSHIESHVEEAENEAYVALARLSLVSRMHYKLASALLYRQVLLHNKMGDSAAVCLLKTNMDVAARVSKLVLETDQDDDDASDEEGGEKGERVRAFDLRSLLLACRNVSCLRIDAPTCVAFPWTSSLTVLDNTILASITSLDLPFGHDASAATASLLLMIPALQRLRLMRYHNGTALQEPLPPLNQQTRLEHFNLTCFGPGENALPGLSTLIQSSSKCLTSLTLNIAGAMLNAEALLEELTKVSRFIAMQDLRLSEIRGTATSFLWTKLGNRFPVLKHLRIDFVDESHEERTFAHVTPCLEAIPQLQCAPHLKSISLNTPGIFKATNFSCLQSDVFTSLQRIHLRSELLKRDHVGIPGLLGSQEQFITLVEHLQGVEVERFFSDWKGCAVEIELGQGNWCPLWKASNDKPALVWCCDVARKVYIEDEMYPEF